MACFLIYVFLLILIDSSLAELSCGDNERVENCPSDCDMDWCPTDELDDLIPCSKPDVCPPPACKCALNYRRHGNGTCIPAKDCPPFFCAGINEEYDPCPSSCASDNCDDSTPSGACRKPVWNPECKPGCRCIKGFWRNDDVCVPHKECQSFNNVENDYY